jgi:hypothetical protein
MTTRSPASLLLALSIGCAALAAQPAQFQFSATVATPTINQVDYSVRVGGLVGSAIDSHLQGNGGVFALSVYYVADALGNDLDRIALPQFTRVALTSGAGTFTIPAHTGQTTCIFSLEAPNLAWGLAGPYSVGARVPQIAANAGTRCGVIGGAYTDVGSPFRVHGLLNSAIVPLPREIARAIMDGQKALVLRDPVSGQTRHVQVAPWTHWLEFHNGQRLLKEVVAYFANAKPGALGEYYEQLELHAVPAAQVLRPEFRLHPDLLRASTIGLEATPAVGTGSYVFERELGRPDEILVDGPMVKILRYRGALQPVGAIANPVPAQNCPIVNIIVELYSGESFVNVKALLSNSRFEGSGHFIFDRITLRLPGSDLLSHGYDPPGLGRTAYRVAPAGTDSLVLVPASGPGRHNRLRESGSFLWNMGIFADFGSPTPRLRHAADNLRIYLTQFFGDRTLGANYFDQPFSRAAGIPDLRYQGMMEDWKTSWQRPSGINNNAQSAFSIYAHRFHLHFDDGPGTVPYPYPCFGPRGGADTGADESMMPHNGAVVLAYNANSVAIVEAIETALFMARGALTRQPIDTLFLADGRANSLDHMRYRMWDAPSGQRIPEARMFGGTYFYNSGNNTRSLFHPNLDYRRSAAHQRHVAEGVIPYNELLGAHDTQHCQRYTTHVMEALYKTNPCFLGKVYMDAAAEMMASLSHYIAGLYAYPVWHVVDGRLERTSRRRQWRPVLPGLRPPRRGDVPSRAAHLRRDHRPADGAAHPPHRPAEWLHGVALWAGRTPLRAGAGVGVARSGQSTSQPTPAAHRRSERLLAVRGRPALAG